MKSFAPLACALSALVSLQALAAGDPAAGQAKSAICAACHGPDGNSAVPQWPKLAGQHPAYLERQATLIQQGARSVPEMAGIVAMLTPQDIADVSAFFAAQQIQAGVADEAQVAVGQRLWRAGNPKTGIPACMACHGPAGEGNPLAGYPALAGQHATYSASMLRKFRDGQNWGEKDAGSTTMNGVAAALSDPEIDALASYVQGLHLATE